MTVGVAAAVVVAVVEQIGDRLAVAAPVARKHLEPGVGDELQLRSGTVVGKVAADEDTVGAPLVERAQSLFPAGGVVARSDVNVAQNAEFHLKRTLVGGFTAGRQRSRRAESDRSPHERSSIYHLRFSLTLSYAVGQMIPQYQMRINAP